MVKRTVWHSEANHDWQVAVCCSFCFISCHRHVILPRYIYIKVRHRLQLRLPYLDPQQLAKATCSDHTEENEEDYTREQSAQSEQPPATIDEGQTVKMIEHAWISIAFLRYVVILYCLFLASWDAISFLSHSLSHWSLIEWQTLMNYSANCSNVMISHMHAHFYSGVQKWKWITWHAGFLTINTSNI